MSKILTQITLILVFNTLSSQDLVRFEENNFFGFKNRKGNIVIPANYGFAEDFKDGYVIVAKDIGRPNQVKQLSILNQKGEKIIEETYEKIINLGFGLFAVGVEDFGNYDYGIVNSKGETILDIKYSNDFKINDSLIVFSKNRIGYGVIDFNGEKIIPIQSEFFIREFKDGISIVGINHNNQGIINKKGEFIINPKNSNITFSSNFNKYGIAVFKRNNKYGIINSIGKIIVEAIYNSPSGLTDKGVVFYEKGPVWYDGKGQKIN